MPAFLTRALLSLGLAAVAPFAPVHAAEPKVLGVKVWALAHLIANRTLADELLFGAFLLWAVLAFRSLRQRDRAAGVVYPAGRAGPTVVAVVVGVLIWAGFAFWAHGLLIGVRPFGGAIPR